MEIKTLTEALALARRLAAEARPDAGDYARLERYLMGNASAHGREADYVAALGIADDVARRLGLPTVRQQQEGFGLNSCAQ